MKSQTIRYGILLADLIWLLGALGLGISLRYGGTTNGIQLLVHFQAYRFMIIAGLLAWTFLYFEMSLDGFKGGWHFPAMLSKIIVAVFLLMALILAVAFLTRQYYSRLVLFYFALAFGSGLLGLRWAVHLLLTSQLRNLADQRCVVLGHGRIARELAAKIALHPEVPFQIIGFLFQGEADTFNGFAGALDVPFTSVKTLQILDLLVEQRVQKLIIAMSQPNGAEIRKLIDECRRASIHVYLVPQWYDLYLSKAELMEIDGLPLVSLQERHPVAAGLFFKRVIDLFLSVAILLFCSPVLAVAALMVRSKTGRAFRNEIRCGKDGVPFTMCRLNVERHKRNPAYWERFFVRWSLTELPQLWNVLRGDMSLVGPRPEPPERVKDYSEWQRRRLKVRPGVTGLAQVHGLREQHSSEEKAHFDLQYILNCSPFLDLSLILQTVGTVLTRGVKPEPPAAHPTLRTLRNDFATEETVSVNRP